mgnify:CR=1 FL=1
MQDTVRGTKNLSADVEAFARPLWGLVPFWAGGGENETFEKVIYNRYNKRCG